MMGHIMKYLVYVPKLSKTMEFTIKAVAERTAAKMRASGFVAMVSEVVAVSCMAEQLAGYEA